MQRKEFLAEMALSFLLGVPFGALGLLLGAKLNYELDSGIIYSLICVGVLTALLYLQRQQLPVSFAVTKYLALATTAYLLLLGFSVAKGGEPSLGPNTVGILLLPVAVVFRKFNLKHDLTDLARAAAFVLPPGLLVWHYGVFNIGLGFSEVPLAEALATALGWLTQAAVFGYLAGRAMDKIWPRYQTVGILYRS